MAETEVKDGPLETQARAYAAVKGNEGQLLKEDARVIAAALDLYASIGACETISEVVGNEDFDRAMHLRRGFKEAAA